MQKVRGTQDWFEKESFYFRSMEEQFLKKLLLMALVKLKRLCLNTLKFSTALWAKAPM